MEYIVEFVGSIVGWIMFFLKDLSSGDVGLNFLGSLVSFWFFYLVGLVWYVIFKF